MALSRLRRLLPHYEIEDHSYDIGYWSRIAGEKRPPSRASDRYVDGWEQADRELEEERDNGKEADQGSRAASADPQDAAPSIPMSVGGDVRKALQEL